MDTIITRESTKMCKRCGEYKSLTSFNKNSKNADGLQNWCRDCYKEYNTKQYNAKKVFSFTLEKPAVKEGDMKAVIDDMKARAEVVDMFGALEGEVREIMQETKDETTKPFTETKEVKVLPSKDVAKAKKSEVRKALADFTGRELISELKRRGYRWSDMIHVTKVDYDKF